ncbi:MAG: helix-turn-helix domain-containing protein [Candidatus Merdivicinus sp.]
MNLNIVDSYCWEEHRKILTPVQTQIPALRTFGIFSNTHASRPVQPHIHQNCVEIVFLLKGFQVYETETEHFNLSGWDIFVAYPNELHSSGIHPESICDLIWMQIDLSPDLPFLGLDEENAAILREALHTLPRLFTGDALLRQMLTEAFADLRDPQPLTHSMGQQLLVSALFRMKRLSLSPHLRQSDRIGDAVSYIQDHIADSIDLEDVAQACGLSLSRFKVKFKEETGTPPREYINHVKVERAKKMLLVNRNVTETALDLGYTTSSYFSVIFKKYTGFSPSQYLERELASQSKIEQEF